MKTAFLITSLLSATAFAEVNIDQALQIRNQKGTQTAPGMVIGQFDVEAVKKAASSLGGKVSIHFGPNDSMILEQASSKSGGVIIGSGTDGNSNNLLLTPPIRPNMSITVTAREGSRNFSGLFCVRSKDADPRVENTCIKTGSTLRILNAGTYLVFFNSGNFGFSALEVSIKPGVNAVIPAREIQIGYSSDVVGHNLYADFSAKSELEKFRQIAPNTVFNYYPKGTDRFGYWIDYAETIFQRILGKNFDVFLSNTTIDNFGQLVFTDNSLPAIQSAFQPIGLSPMSPPTTHISIGSFYTSPKKKEAFFNVMPGTYGLQWQFKDGQIDYTKGIVVD